MPRSEIEQTHATFRTGTIRITFEYNHVQKLHLVTVLDEHSNKIYHQWANQINTQSAAEALAEFKTRHQC